MLYVSYMQMYHQSMATYKPQLSELFVELVCHLKAYHYSHVNSAEAVLFQVIW